MKQLKFRHKLVQSILDGMKTVTWRLFDDKDLQVGDQLQLIDAETGEEFAQAEIRRLREKPLGAVTTEDFEGHEIYRDTMDMLRHYKEYYGDKVTLKTPVKIVDFKVIR